MSESTVVVQGVVRPDGTLEIEGKVLLPPGPVQVTVQPVFVPPEGDPFFDMLQETWAAREKAGLKPRSVEEVEALRRQLRDESESEVNAAVQLQEECRRSQQTGEAQGGGRE
jgi:hypothetical protein